MPGGCGIMRARPAGAGCQAAAWAARQDWAGSRVSEMELMHQRWSVGTS